MHGLTVRQYLASLSLTPISGAYGEVGRTEIVMQGVM